MITSIEYARPAAAISRSRKAQTMAIVPTRSGLARPATAGELVWIQEWGLVVDLAQIVSNEATQLDQIPLELLPKAGWSSDEGLSGFIDHFVQMYGGEFSQSVVVIEWDAVAKPLLSAYESMLLTADGRGAKLIESPDAADYVLVALDVGTMALTNANGMWVGTVWGDGDFKTGPYSELSMAFHECRRHLMDNKNRWGSISVLKKWAESVARAAKEIADFVEAATAVGADIENRFDDPSVVVATFPNGRSVRASVAPNVTSPSSTFNSEFDGQTTAYEAGNWRSALVAIGYQT